MAAAEGDGGVGVDADRELEELLDSKSPGGKKAEQGGHEDPLGAPREPEVLGGAAGKAVGLASAHLGVPLVPPRRALGLPASRGRRRPCRRPAFHGAAPSRPPLTFVSS